MNGGAGFNRPLHTASLPVAAPHAAFRLQPEGCGCPSFRQPRRMRDVRPTVARHGAFGAKPPVAARHDDTTRYQFRGLRANTRNHKEAQRSTREHEDNQSRKMLEQTSVLPPSAIRRPASDYQSALPAGGAPPSGRRCRRESHSPLTPARAKRAAASGQESVEVTRRVLTSRRRVVVSS